MKRMTETICPSLLIRVIHVVMLTVTCREWVSDGIVSMNTDMVKCPNVNVTETLLKTDINSAKNNLSGRSP